LCDSPGPRFALPGAVYLQGYTYWKESEKQIAVTVYLKSDAGRTGEDGGLNNTYVSSLALGISFIQYG